MGDLLPLLDNDRLRQALEPFIVSILQSNESHIDRTLVMGDHHQHEVAIGLAAGRDFHGLVHAPDDLRNFRIERGSGPSRWRGVSGPGCPPPAPNIILTTHRTTLDLLP